MIGFTSSNWALDKFATFSEKLKMPFKLGWFNYEVCIIVVFRLFSEPFLRVWCKHISYIVILECKYQNLMWQYVYFMYLYVVADSEIKFIKDGKLMIVVISCDRSVNLRGNCILNQKLACFALCLKIVNTSLENNVYISKASCPRNSKMALGVSACLVGQSVFRLWIKIVRILFW